MSAPVHYALVKRDGTLHTICSLFAGKTVEIRERKSKRSVAANRRYWALLTLAARDLGYDDVEELHEGVALKLLRLPEIVPGVPRRRRTPALNTQEFTEFVDGAERLLTNMGANLTGWQELEASA